jgi:hypothetical protein
MRANTGIAESETQTGREWEIAAETLLAAVEGSGPLMFAEIAMRKAVNAGKPVPEPTPRGRAAKK